MPLNLPQNQNQIFQRLAADTQARLPGSNPYLRNSYWRAILQGYSGSLFEWYVQLNDAVNQIFFDTAEDEFLERWASIFGITRNPATKASGFVTATGTAGTIIPLGTVYNNSEGSEYASTASATITAQSISVSSLTRSGSTVTATTVSNHNLATNISVTISGAVETDYNGTFIVTVTGLNTFTYEIVGTPTTPATGTILAAFTTASVPLLSTDFGADQNADAGSRVSLSAPIAGADNDAYVQFGALGGGADLESDEDLRARFLEFIQNPVALFNEAAIIAQAKTVSGVTRVFVRNVDDLDDSVSITTLTHDGSNLATAVTASPHGLEDGQLVSITGATESEYNIEAKVLVIDTTTFAYVVVGSPTTPATGTPLASFSITSPGQVRIFFVRDNDGTGTAILPTGAEVTAVKDAILEIKPAHTSDTDVIVSAPIANLVDVTFSSLTPNTADMQTAIEANLEQFFSESVTVGQDLLLTRIEAVISSTIDSSGNTVTSFSLTDPPGDVSVAANELPILGTVTF